MSQRSERIRLFLESGIWQIAEDREHTRRALREFLPALPEEQFTALVDDPAIFVLATAGYLVTSAVPWAGCIPGVDRSRDRDRTGDVTGLTALHKRA